MVWTTCEVNPHDDGITRLVEYSPNVLYMPEGWTLRGAIQPHIDIYLSEETFAEVKVTFPYLVQKEFATGGGDVRCPSPVLA